MSDTSKPSVEEQVFNLLAAARSALDLANHALKLFEERLPEVIEQHLNAGVIVKGRRLERSSHGPLTARGLIGAQAFLANLVIVENCVGQLARLPGAPEHFSASAVRSLAKIRGVIDRRVRNTTEHIDERVTRADVGLIANTIFEPDLLGSTRADGSMGYVAITRDTWQTVAGAMDDILRTAKDG